MLAGVARCKLQYRANITLQPAFEQIYLPWLCPASLRHKKFFRKTSTISYCTKIGGHTRVQQESTVPRRVQRKQKSRGFAYAAAAIENDSPSDYIPFEHARDFARETHGEESLRLAWPRKNNSLTSLPTFDPSSLVVLNDSVEKPPQSIRVSNGIGGYASDIRTTLLACLHVGRLERAEAMMRRLNITYKPEAPEIIQLHNEYIESLLTRTITTKDQALLKYLQRWFEVDVRAKGIAPNAITYALMIRSSFQESRTVKVDRTIRRYIGLASQAGIWPETKQITISMLNSQELGRFAQIGPTTLPATVDDAADSLETEFVEKDGLDVPDDIETVNVRPVDQKGLGLKALERSLSSFSDVSISYREEARRTHTNRTNPSLYAHQQRIEEDTMLSAISRWRTEEEQMKRMGLSNKLGSPTMGSLMWAWHEALVPLIREEISKAHEAESKTDRDSADLARCAYGPFLQYISSEKLSAITILTCLSMINRFRDDRGTTTSSTLMAVGSAVQDEAISESVKNHQISGIQGDLSSLHRCQELANIIKRQPHKVHLAGLLRNEASAAQLIREDLWSPTIKAKIGAVLVSHIIQAAKVNVVLENPETGEKSEEAQPAFWSSYQYRGGRTIGVLRMNKAMGRKLTAEPVSCTLSRHLPMVVEPVPWTGVREGGYLLQPVNVVRVKAGHTQTKNYIRAAADSGDMQQIFAGLDILGKTPWKINRGVFDVMVEAWNTGERIANLAPLNPKYDFPPEPEQTRDPRAHLAWRYQMKYLTDERNGYHSKRCFQNFQLEVAKAYLNKTFYFPHNLDFRGRAYPIPPYLNHMGADNCRGLLLFGQGKELGVAGLTWLKVHLANVFGFDKASFEERRDFANNHLVDIYDSASNPLAGNKWWLEAEDPWQCLAACMELKQALDCADPTTFVSHLPIHQDGTCNGLQHYAALGGDSLGAKQVNLEPGKRPSDIYTGVAEMIEGDLREEAAQGVEVAKLLKGRLTRKVVKQTVMTNVYGVTFVGAKRQVRRQLDELMPDFPSRADMNRGVAAQYITRKIFKALSTMFKRAHHIQYWLGDCAARICDALSADQIQLIEETMAGKAEPSSFAGRTTNRTTTKDEQYCFKSSVIWTTPLKMPVVQPYRKSSSKAVVTNLQSITLQQPTLSEPVNKREQLQAFPPNFIHSLDATHMMLSALKCDEIGLQFAAVHDSFWTHATDVDIMNRVLRDAFIRMHSEDIIGRLAAEFAARYKGSMYLASVRANSILGKKVSALRRARCQMKDRRQTGKIKELLEERNRLRLLASEDPAEQAEGEAIITPSRLFEEIADENDLAPVEELEEVGIGQVPLNQEACDAQETVMGHGGGLEDDDPQSIFSDKHETPVLSADPDTSRTGAEFEVESENVTLQYVSKSKAEKAKQQRYRRKVWLWLPLTFPPLPEKGDFDVTRLKDSQYFFS